MSKFSQQRVLILGSNVGSAEIVKYARLNDAYTIVADNLPPEQSRAKLVSDDSVLISTADIDSLISFVARENITNVMSGISEFNLTQSIEIAKACGMPFYCTRAQWDSVGRKDQFRKQCEKFKVPCPKTWFVGNDTLGELSSIVYPVVIKPVDASASVGVRICKNEIELLDAEIVARNQSKSGAIIVESFFSGTEFTAHYTISGGRARLSMIDDRHGISIHEGTVTTIPVARVYPSTCLTDYLEQVDPAMIALSESLGVTNAVMFIQGIHDKTTGNFTIFEGGLRPAAEATWRLVNHINGINPLHHLVDQCILGNSNYELSREDPRLGGAIGSVVSLAGRSGNIGKIVGVERVLDEVSSIFDWESRYSVGSFVPDSDSLRQIMIRFFMHNASACDLVSDIEFINRYVHVFNESGEEISLHFNPQELHFRF